MQKLSKIHIFTSKVAGKQAAIPGTGKPIEVEKQKSGKSYIL